LLKQVCGLAIPLKVEQRSCDILTTDVISGVIFANATPNQLRKFFCGLQGIEVPLLLNCPL
jgi:hypothetical protein